MNMTPRKEKCIPICELYNYHMAEDFVGGNNCVSDQYLYGNRRNQLRIPAKTARQVTLVRK